MCAYVSTKSCMPNAMFQCNSVCNAQKKLAEFLYLTFCALRTYTLSLNSQVYEEFMYMLTIYEYVCAPIVYAFLEKHSTL